VLPPYYHPLAQREVLRLFLTLAEASPKPLILHENSRLTRNTLATRPLRNAASRITVDLRASVRVPVLTSVVGPAGALFSALRGGLQMKIPQFDPV